MQHTKMGKKWTSNEQSQIDVQKTYLQRNEMWEINAFAVFS